MSVVLFIVAACAFYILFLIMFNPPDDGKRMCGSVRTEHIPRSNQEKENEKKKRRKKVKTPHMHSHKTGCDRCACAAQAIVQLNSSMCVRLAVVGEYIRSPPPDLHDVTFGSL